MSRGPDSAVDVETTGRGNDGYGRALIRMRYGPNGTQPGWSWGPKSSSEDKAEWMPKMMGHTTVK